MKKFILPLAFGVGAGFATFEFFPPITGIIPVSFFTGGFAGLSTIIAQDVFFNGNKIRDVSHSAINKEKKNVNSKVLNNKKKVKLNNIQNANLYSNESALLNSMKTDNSKSKTKSVQTNQAKDEMSVG